MEKHSGWLKEHHPSCVVVGTFNIYIFQPEWLSRVLELKDGTRFEIQTDLSRPGFKLTSQDFDCNWIVRPGRIQLEGTSPKAHLPETLIKVLKRLPETPLYAVGKNFSFEVVQNELLHPELLAQLDFPAIPNGNVTRSAVVVSAQIDQALFSFALFKKADSGVEIAVNVHRDVSELDHSEVVNELQRFDHDRERAREIVNNLWKRN